MTDVRISQLDELRDVADDDVLIVNDKSDGNKTKVTRKKDLLYGLSRNIADDGPNAIINQDLIVNNDILLDGDIRTTGSITFGMLKDHAKDISVNGFVDNVNDLLVEDSVLPTAGAVRSYVSHTLGNIDLSDLGNRDDDTADSAPAFVKLEPLSGQVIRYEKNGITENDTLEFRAVTENFGVEEINFDFFVDGELKNSISHFVDSARFFLADGDEPQYDENKNIKVTVTSGEDKRANDYVTVYGIKDGVDGIDAVTAFLTNEVHTEPADSAGKLTGDLTDAGGFLKVFVGVTDITGDNSLTYSKGTELGITSEILSTGEYKINSFNSLATDKGSVELNVAVPKSLIPNADTGITVTKKYSIAKLIGGSGRDGANGINARTVKVLPLNGQVVRYDEEGVELDELTFKAVPENVTGPVSYRWKIKNATENDAAFETPQALLQNSDSVDFTLPDNEEPTVKQVRVLLCEMYETDEDGNEIEVAQDIISLYGLTNGFSVTGFLTNETHVEPADSDGSLPIILDDDGNQIHLNDAGGLFKVYLGTTDITGDLTSGDFSITENTGINVLMNYDNVPGKYRLQSFDEVSTPKGSATLTATVPASMIPTTEEDVVIEKQFSVAKSFRGRSGPPGLNGGVNGQNARAVKLEPVNGQVYRYGEDGLPIAGQEFRFNVVDQQGFDAGITYKFYVKDGPGATKTQIKPASGTTSDAYVILSGEGQLPDIQSTAVITVEAFEGTDYTTVVARDYVTMYGLADGTSITGFLTNESHVEPFLRNQSDSTKTAVNPKDGSYSTAGGNFKVFRGITEITSECSFAWDNANSTGGVFAIDAATGEYSVTSLEETAFVASAVFEVTVPKELVAKADADLTLDKKYSIAKSIDGVDGSGFVSDLTNENHSIAAANDGVPYNYTGATTTFTVYDGADDVTPTAENIVRTKVPATGTNNGNLDDNFSYDISTDGRTITITHMGKNVDTATVTFIALGRTETFTLTKVKAGENGSPAVVYRLLTSANVVKADFAGETHVPPSVTFTQAKVIGNGAQTNGNYGELRIFVTNSAGSESEYASSGRDAQSRSYTIADGVKQIRTEMWVDGAKVDEETVPVVNDGEDADPVDPPDPLTIHRLLSSTAVVREDTAGTTHAPAAVTFTQARVIGNDPQTTGNYGQIRIYVTPDGGSESEHQSSSRATASRQYTVADNTDQIRAEMWVGSPLAKVDEITIPIIVDGTSSAPTEGSRGPGRWHIDVDGVDYASGTDGRLPNSNSDAQKAWETGIYADGAAGSAGDVVSGDQAWFYQGDLNAPDAQSVWIYSGSAWVEQQEVIDGNLLVDGTVTADKFVTSAIVDASQNGGQTIITPDVIQIFEITGGTRTLRVKLGNLTIAELNANGE
jgi:hypothetical protein